MGLRSCKLAVVNRLGPRLRLLNLRLTNFKCFESLELEFDRGSELGGEWTCLAGINGAGKSSILQALALVLLEPETVYELGRDRLTGFARRSGAANFKVEIETEMGKFSIEAGDGKSNFNRNFDLNMLVLGYGASRNLSSGLNPSQMSNSIEKRRILSLFEPFAPFANAEIFFRHAAEVPHNFSTLFAATLRGVFPDELPIADDMSHLTFSIKGAAISIEELPDGYRSSLAWLSDLCWNWSKLKPECVNPSEVEAIVMIDEIDLHLHPQLQRSLVPRLRQIFPRVQWIVTTHSPLVLGCFDKNEIILLDAESPGGVELVERQVLGLSADQITAKLMGTSPTSGALEQKLKEAEDDASLRENAVSLIESEAGKEPILSPSEVSSLLTKLTR